MRSNIALMFTPKGSVFEASWVSVGRISLWVSMPGLCVNASFKGPSLFPSCGRLHLCDLCFMSYMSLSNSTSTSCAPDCMVGIIGEMVKMKLVPGLIPSYTNIELCDSWGKRDTWKTAQITAGRDKGQYRENVWGGTRWGKGDAFEG